MADRTGKVILAKDIRLDRSYKNIMNYTESQMVSLVQSKKVYEATNCSFVRQGENIISLDITFGTALQANYIAFQNPDYSYKWFFGFIDEVEYKGDHVSYIHFTIDECSTWFDYWHVEPCFVIREHTNDDSIGSNLLPENLELGEYVQNADDPEQVGFGGVSRYVLNTSYYPGASDATLGVNLCGVPIAGGIVAFDYWQQMINAIQTISGDGHLEGIKQAFIMPDDLVDTSDSSLWQIHGTTDDNAWYSFKGSNSPIIKRKVISAPTTINGYTPKNKKLLSAPFQYCMLVNNNGSATSLNYEYFSNRSAFVIEAKGTICVGGSIVVYPENYKGVEKNYNEGITAGKFPTLSWSGDSYTNWLTQNAVNIGLGVVGDAINLATGFGATQKANEQGLIRAKSQGMAGHFTPESQTGNVVDFGLSIASTVGNIYQHSICSQSIRGNTNSGDMHTSNKTNTVYLYKMSIRSEFAHIIDDFFDRKGYLTNRIKVPNQTGRPHWNYVQIASDDDIGYSNQPISVPTKSMDIINNVYRNGTTIWHHHSELGDYSLDNTIQ